MRHGYGVNLFVGRGLNDCHLVVSDDTHKDTAGRIKREVVNTTLLVRQRNRVGQDQRRTDGDRRLLLG
jgi:hypothetical protein